MRRIVIVAMLAGCGARGGKSVDRSVLVATSPSDDVVATVDGRPIFASDVVAQAQASHVDAKTALAQLVDAEALAGAAVDRGLYDDADVVQARRAAEARRLLATDFEPRTTKNRIPNDDLRSAYDLSRRYYNRDEIAEVQHIIAAAPDTGPAAMRQVAHDEMVALLPRAKATTTAEAFAALADPDAKAPMHVEQLGFPRHDAVVESFAAAAFSLTKPGQVTGPVETSFGWHILRLVQRAPARHESIQEAESELRDGVFEPWRKHQLELYIQGLVERFGAVEHPERLEQLDKP